VQDLAQTFASPPSAPPVADFREYARFGYVAIAIVFGGFGVWASLAPLDSAAVAPGRVSVESDRKPVQHLEGGIIREILVKEAQRVAEGQVLFRLQPIQAQANSDILRKQLDAALAQEARLVAEREWAPRIAFPEEILARRHVPETAAAMLDQQSQFAERLRSVNSQIEVLKARISQTERDIEGRSLRGASLQSQLKSISDEIANVSTLVQKGYYARNKFAALERERSRLEGEMGLGKGEVARLMETIEESRVQIRLTRERQVEAVVQQLAEVRARISDTREKLGVAQDVLSRVEVKAPKAGIVQAIKVATVGAVVKPGEPIAEVIPVGDQLVLSAKVSPQDIHNVVAGQKADVRFAAFSKQYNGLPGRLESISADSLMDEATKQPYYNAKVVIDPAHIPQEIAAHLTPGMPADVLINTGERTMLQYLIGPLLNRVAKTMREK